MWDRMTLHWGRTLQNKQVHLRPRLHVNYTIPFTYNYTEYKLSKEKIYWDELMLQNKNRSNQNQTTILYAENQFLKKTDMLSDMTDHKEVRHQSFTAVIVISSLFLFLTLSITAAVIVFCRKKNTVFALQKSEQDDYDYEMDDMNTDIEFTETDFESETESVRTRTRSVTHSVIESDCDTSPVHQGQIVGHSEEAEPPDSPEIGRHLPNNGAGIDNRGAYQRMVVTAVLERGGGQGSPNPIEGQENRWRPVPAIQNEARTNYLRNLHKKYYGTNTNGDYEKLPTQEQLPTINISYADNPPSYESLQYLPKVIVTSCESCGQKTQGYHMTKMDIKYESCVVDMQVCDDEASTCMDHGAVCVHLPDHHPEIKLREIGDDDSVFIDIPENADCVTCNTNSPTPHTPQECDQTITAEECVREKKGSPTRAESQDSQHTNISSDSSVLDTQSTAITDDIVSRDFSSDKTDSDNNHGSEECLIIRDNDSHSLTQ